MALGLDLAELSRSLKQERLFVTSEREQLQNLYEQVKTTAEQLYHQSWISRQQKDVLDSLIGSSREAMAVDCCLKTNQLEATNFIDGYKYLSYHDSKYGEFLQFLLETPGLVGQILAAEEKASSINTQGVVKTLMHSVYGNCVLQEDETRMLHMLKSLLELQLATCNNPRLMLRRGSCAFSIACRQLFDVLFSAKLFLTGALHDPVMRLLMEDEWFYDIDPGKALVRFPALERQRRFGEPGTDQYKTALAKYRETIVNKLVIMANRFITSIKNNMHCFPPSLAWLVSQVYHTLTKTGKLDVSEVRSVCADLVFALFICPAICDPEPHGITTDVQISHIARHNLMQMAQIIQTLALSHWEEIDAKQLDLYNRFEKGCLSSLLDTLVDGLGLELPGDTSNTQLPCLDRTSSLITMSQLNTLISYLRAAFPQVSESSDKKMLDEILSGLTPITPPTPIQNPAPPTNTAMATPPGTPIVSKKNKHKKKSVVSMMSQTSDDTMSVSSLSMEPDTPSGQQVEDVLVISLGNDIECPGMMSEQKVLSYEQENKRRRVKYQAPGGYEGGEMQEKRTRFSLSHDQESIGNSDIPEAISEGASSHSVGSQDLENDDNDNFSDMISANVSGRGTPNISGRDTPLSQAESVEQEPQQHAQPPLPETIQKKNRVDVTEKFGKFDIKQELEYDLKSTVSDTWSTDVLASDSEPPEMNQQVRLEEIAEEMVRQHMLATHEVSETASDAWSTDVLASDTEEKQGETLSEFDDLSMAEMGGNLDEVRSESDIAEVTPLASGFQSPSDNADQFRGVALGGGSVKSENMSMSPTFSDNVFSDSEMERHGAMGSRLDGDRDRRPSSGSRSDRLLMDSPVGIGSNRLFVPIKKKRDPSPTGTPSDKYRGAANGGFSNSSANRHLENWSGASRPMSAPGPYRDVTTELQNLHLASNILASGETGARPKSQNNVNFNATNKVPLLMKNKLDDHEVRTDNSDFQTGLFRHDRKGRISADSGVSSAQFLDTGENKELVNLCDQQNTNLSEERLSTTLSLFDPLSPDKQMTGGALLEGAGSPHERAFRSYQGNKNLDTSEPLIQIEKQDKSNQYLFDVTPTNTKQSGAISAMNQVFLPTVVTGEQRRSSTDSMRSSESGNSKEGSGSGQGDKSERCSLDHNSGSLVTNGKDFSPVGEEIATPGTKKRGLFRTFKEKINKGIKKKGSSKHDKENTPEKGHVVDGAVGEDKQTIGTPEPNIIVTETETSDAILAKYRKKSILASTPNTEPIPTEKERRLTMKDNDDPTPLYDPSNLENCLAFLDAKRKLRIVLSSGDFQVNHGAFSGGALSYSPRELESPGRDKNNELVNLLRTQLSEAINLQNRDTIAQLHEAIRCVKMFDTEGCKKLVRCLQEDYSSRSSYISYLVRCKQGLLSTLSHINRLHSRMKREKEIYNRHLTNVCVRMFLECWEKHMMSFISDFQKLTMSDEKTDLVERFLQFLYHQVDKDAIWNAATELQLDDARLAIERLIMSRIYTHAMFPNGDGDIHRDQLIQNHIKQLSKVITPHHKDMRIPKMYHLECPWPAAQREIYMINAYKTPSDKLKCIHRCATTVMNLLSLANEKSVPAADDFMPVFIFVIIKANPPCLLSTIQYVNSFYGNRLQGEEQYWWIQFCAAVEFIKTMDYTRENSSDA